MNTRALMVSMTHPSLRKDLCCGQSPEAEQCGADQCPNSYYYPSLIDLFQDILMDSQTTDITQFAGFSTLKRQN